jgi:hypothetical protein
MCNLNIQQQFWKYKVEKKLHVGYTKKNVEYHSLEYSSTKCTEIGTRSMIEISSF